MNQNAEKANQEKTKNAPTCKSPAPSNPITGGTEHLRGEEKGIQSGIFRQTPKLIFSANKMPESICEEQPYTFFDWIAIILPLDEVNK